MGTAPRRPQFIGAGRLRARTTWRAKSHAHERFEAIVVWSGRLGVRVSGQKLVLGPGDAAVYPPGRAHEERVVGARSCDFAYFSYRSAPRPEKLNVHDRDGRMRLIVQWLLEEQSSAHVGKRRVLDAHVASFLAEFEKCGSLAEPTIVDAVRAYARGRLSDRLSADELAAHVHMSRAHFIRTYRKLAGRPPMADVRMLRIEAARDLIITTRLPLKAIAPKVGFSDEFHLAHVFRKHLDVPPSYFRRSE